MSIVDGHWLFLFVLHRLRLVRQILPNFINDARLAIGSFNSSILVYKKADNISAFR